MSMEFCALDGSRVYAQALDREGSPFIVTSMFTADLRESADRLRSSLEQFSLNFALYEVPTVHRSISTKGTDDLSFCKPNFIHHMLGSHGLPVLYVDIDVVFRDVPTKLFSFGRDHIAFASYNWLADDANHAYAPVDVAGTSIRNRYYRYSHCVNGFDPTQLIVSGAVQYYSIDAHALLRAWLEAIGRFPKVADDELLDFAFNLASPKNSVRASWLMKEYCRYAWWIQVRPVIDHPHLPALRDPQRSFSVSAGHERFNLESIKTWHAPGFFPRDCLIDTVEKQLLRIDRFGRPEVVRPLSTELWIDPVD